MCFVFKPRRSWFGFALKNTERLSDTDRKTRPVLHSGAYVCFSLVSFTAAAPPALNYLLALAANKQVT